MSNAYQLLVLYKSIPSVKSRLQDTEGTKGLNGLTWDPYHLPTDK